MDNELINKVSAAHAKEGLRKCKGTFMVYKEGWWQPEVFDVGYFHQWGVNYEEFESGPGNYTTAVVELPDGRVVMPTASDIVFLD